MHSLIFKCLIYIPTAQFGGLLKVSRV